MLDFVGAGTINAGNTINVSFDLNASLSGAGGVVFVELIYLNAAGEDYGQRSLLLGGPIVLATTPWTNFSDSVQVPAVDVAGGVALQLKSSCGPIPDGCSVDAYFDNVTFTVTP